jgi:hypothetical protein
MRNRIFQPAPKTTPVSPVFETEVLEHCQRPTLRLTNHTTDRPITVDMERFFDFSFSFAEALVDLEAMYASDVTETSPRIDMDLEKRESQLDAELDFDIDARWM